MSKKTPETKQFERLTQEYTQARAYRENKVENRWRDIIQLALPMYGEYGDDPLWTDRRFDGTATECIGIVGDAIYGKVCGASINWFVYEFTDERQNRDSRYRDIAEALTEHQRDVFRRSTFYDVAAEWLNLYVGLGLATLDIQEDEAEGRIICRVENPRGIYLASNSRNRIDTCYQRVWLTVEQAVEKWGEEKLDKDLRKEFHDIPSSRVYEFLNVIKPRRTAKAGSMLKTEMPFASYWIRPGDPRQTIIEESGDRTFPKPTARWKTRGNDPYPWSLSDDVLPDIRTINDMAAAHIIAAQKTADPAKWYPPEGRSWSDDPGKTNYYTDPNRKPFYSQSSSSFRFNDKMFDQFRERIRQGYKVNHFLMLRPEAPGDRTAREVLEIKKEQASVTGAPTAKVETEGLDAVHDRLLQIELDAGRLENILPRALLEGATPLKMRVKYLGPLSQLQREVQAQEEILGALESVFPVMQAFPQTIHKIKRPELVVERLLRSKQFPNESIATVAEYARALEEEARKAEAIKENILKQELAKGVDPNAKPQPGSPGMALVGRSA